jgi:hypothetical protein
MKRTGTFALGLAVGLGIAFLIQLAPAGAARGRGAGVPAGNGDVNGDGSINLSDAVYLLNWLFLGGTEPDPIDCNPLPASLARFRFTNEIACNQAIPSADLSLCSFTVTSTGGQASSCGTFEVLPDCQLRVTSTSQCTEIGICGLFEPQADRLYDFVLRDRAGEPTVVWYEQPLAPGAECPAPDLTGPPDGSLSVSCGEPPVARFRLVNHHTCGGEPTTAELDFCSQSLTDTSGDDVGACLGVTVAPLCLASARISAGCVNTVLCADLGTDAGNVYDFVLSGDGAEVSGVWFKQPLNPDGSCPPPPDGAAKPAGTLSTSCDGRE